jgi:hypothetical protein
MADVLQQNNPSNAIQSNALNLTRFSGIGAAIVVLLDAINPAIDQLMGGTATPTIRAVIFVAAIAAWAAIAVADILARGYVHAHNRTALATFGREIPATLTDGGLQDGWRAVALSIEGNQLGQILVTRNDASPKWVDQDKLVLGGA